MSGLPALFWEPGRAQVATAVDQAIDGEFRAATASTVKAVGVGVATGIALGELVLPLELKDGAPLILATTSAPSRR